MGGNGNGGGSSPSVKGGYGKEMVKGRKGAGGKRERFQYNECAFSGWLR